MDATSAAAERADADTGPRTTDAELETMRQQLAEEKEKRASAERDRDTERQRVLAERGNRFAAQESAIAGALEMAKARLAGAKHAYAAAMSDERYQDGAELQEQIAEAALEIRGLAWQQQQFEQARRQPAASDARARFEQAIATLPQEAQEWCRRHPDFVTDSRANARAQAAHFAAVGEGLREWSPEYWDFVEDRLGVRQAGPDDGFEEIDYGRDAGASRGRQERQAPAADRPRSRVGATTAAPPSRSAATGTGESRRRTRQPSSGEIEAAKISFPDEWKESPRKALELYFENQAALKREGRL
ncbi:MAG: hypothetical protein ACLQJR_07645 [Stellaceae bacterium]